MSGEAPPVAWVVPYYPWAGDRVSGLFFANQARALAALGVPLTIVAPTPWVPPILARVRTRWRRYREAPRLEAIDGMTVVRPRYPTLPRDLRLAAPDRLIARAAWQARRRWMPAQVVHGHFALTGLGAARVAGRARLPYVLTVHGSDVNTWPERHPEWRDTLVRALRGAARVTAVSEALATRVRDLAGIEAIALPIGIDHAAFRDAARGDPRQRRASAGIGEDHVVALFVGNLLRAKGIHEFVKGVEAAGDPIRGIVIGEGQEASALQTGDARVRWLGRLPNEDVAGWMAAADVLVLPSHSEGLPTVVVEAGSLAMPVIASSVGGIPELLDEGRGILLPEVSPPAVCRALRVLAGDLRAARSAATELRSLVEDRYDVRRNAARLAQLYVEVAAR